MFWTTTEGEGFDTKELFVKLFGKEIDAEIMILASVRGGGDTNDLAWTILEHHQVTDTDVVAGDHDGVWEQHPRPTGVDDLAQCSGCRCCFVAGD